MATFILDGRDYDIAPFKIRELRLAAPHIDRINAATDLASMAGIAEYTGEFIAVVSIGLQKIDPDLTAEEVEARMSYSELAALRGAFSAILTEAGLAPAGEIVADPGEASPKGSAKSSTSSSRQGSKAAAKAA